MKREAEEGRAKNESQARIIVAKAKAEAQIAEADAQRTSSVRANEFAATEAESMRDLQMKQQGFQKEVNEATARAEAAIRIETRWTCSKSAPDVTSFAAPSISSNAAFPRVISSSTV